MRLTPNSMTAYGCTKVYKKVTVTAEWWFHCLSGITFTFPAQDNTRSRKFTSLSLLYHLEGKTIVVADPVETKGNPCFIPKSVTLMAL